MRLSEDRINAIAYKIAYELVKKRAIKTSHKLRQVTTWIEKPIMDNLTIESQLDEEVRSQLSKMSTCPPEGSFAYQALFQRKKEDLARKYQYEL